MKFLKLSHSQYVNLSKVATFEILRGLDGIVIVFKLEDGSSVRTPKLFEQELFDHLSNILDLKEQVQVVENPVKTPSVNVNSPVIINKENVDKEILKVVAKKRTRKTKE